MTSFIDYFDLGQRSDQKIQTDSIQPPGNRELPLCDPPYPLHSLAIVSFDIYSESVITRMMVVYLNNAGQSELSPEVKAAGMAAVQRPPWEPHGSDDQGRIRELFASLIEAEATDIAIMPCTAFAITLAARNIQRTILQSRGTGKILLLQDQFNSAVYPWQQICEESKGSVSLEIVPHPTVGQEGGWTQAILDRLNGNVLATCLPPLHWSNGALIDLETIGVACRQHGVALIVDATQGKHRQLLVF